jgi:hypothetical protein
MARVGRLKTNDMLPELLLRKPARHFPPQTTLSLRRLEMGKAVQSMAGKGRCPFSRDYQDETCTLLTLIGNKLRKPGPGRFK